MSEHKHFVNIDTNTIGVVAYREIGTGIQRIAFGCTQNKTGVWHPVMHVAAIGTLKNSFRRADITNPGQKVFTVGFFCSRK